MPGIAGIIRRGRSEPTDQDLQAMVEAMRHETNYSGGQYINQELGLYVGWMNHHGSFADCMPLVSERTGTVLIFHGENYPTRDVQTRLRACKSVDTRNARYLADLSDELGNDFLRQLNGWYCGVLVNPHSQKITLFNDRYGMGRVYFHEGRDEFLFASEAKSLLRIRHSLRAIQLQSLAEYLRFNCTTGQKTLFDGISLLPNGAAWEFERGVISRRQRYFTFAEWHNQAPLSQKEFYERFADTLSRVFPAYATSSGKVAISLTAGLDTRTIMASLRPRPLTLPCYTFDGPWGELFDARAARRIAEIYGQRFELIRAGDSFLKNFPSFAERAIYISDGTHDAFGAHDIYLNKIARAIAPVRLTGKFGSEVVRARKLVPSLTYPRRLCLPELRSLVEALPSFPELHRDVDPLTRVVSEEIRSHEFGRVSVEQSQVILRTPYLDNELVELMFQAPATVRRAGNLQERYVRDEAPELASIPTDLGRFVSENRLVAEFARASRWALFKGEYIYLYALPHWLTRVDRRLENLKPERVLSGRQKWEAYRIWLKTDLAGFVREMLLNSKAHFTAFFDAGTVAQMVARHTAGTHNYANEINRVLTVELICSRLVSQSR